MKMLIAAAIALLIVSHVSAAPGDRYECKVDTAQRIDIDRSQQKQFGGARDTQIKYTVLEHAKEIEVLSRSLEGDMFQDSVPIVGRSINSVHGVKFTPIALSAIAISHEPEPTKNIYGISRLLHNGSFILVWLLACEKYLSPPK